MPRTVKTPRDGDVFEVGGVVIKCRRPKKKRARLAVTFNTPKGMEVVRVRKENGK